MTYTIKTNLANRKNYGDKRDLSMIEYIVIHYTANDGDTDDNNANYFKNNVVYTSAHYFVDDDSVTQTVPDDYVAWAVADKKYTGTKGAKYYGKCINTNSISIELCDDVKDGVIYPSVKTIENAIAFTKSLMKKFNVPQSKVIRHFDVSGKPCPKYWIDDAKWKKEFWNKLVETKKKAEPKTTKKSIEVIAQEVIDGKWGNGSERKTKLEKAGYDYNQIQAKVNELLKPKSIKIGSIVKVKKGAKTYQGGSLASFVYEETYKVKEINVDRVVIAKNNIVIAAIKKQDLILV